MKRVVIVCVCVFSQINLIKNYFILFYKMNLFIKISLYNWNELFVLNCHMTYIHISIRPRYTIGD